MSSTNNFFHWKWSLQPSIINLILFLSLKISEPKSKTNLTKDNDGWVNGTDTLTFAIDDRRKMILLRGGSVIDHQSPSISEIQRSRRKVVSAIVVSDTDAAGCAVMIDDHKCQQSLDEHDEDTGAAHIYFLSYTSWERSESLTEFCLK